MKKAPAAAGRRPSGSESARQLKLRLKVTAQLRGIAGV